MDEIIHFASFFRLFMDSRAWFAAWSMVGRWGAPLWDPVRIVQTRIDVGVLGVRQQTGYLGSLARPGKPIRGWPDTKKHFLIQLELIVLAESSIFEFPAAIYASKKNLLTYNP